MYLSIRQERQNRHWTQEAVAQKIGVTQAMLQKIETGQRKPSYDVLVKLEDLFNLTHRQLFAVADDAPNSHKNNTTKQRKKQENKALQKGK